MVEPIPGSVIWLRIFLYRCLSGGRDRIYVDLIWEI